MAASVCLGVMRWRLTAYRLVFSASPSGVNPA